MMIILAVLIAAPLMSNIEPIPTYEYRKPWPPNYNLFKAAYHPDGGTDKPTAVPSNNIAVEPIHELDYENIPIDFSKGFGFMKQHYQIENPPHDWKRND